jgi:hypothetical protein
MGFADGQHMASVDGRAHAAASVPPGHAILFDARLFPFAVDILAASSIRGGARPKARGLASCVINCADLFCRRLIFLAFGIGVLLTGAANKKDGHGN